MPDRRVLVDAARMTIGTLTALPVPAPGRIDRPVAALAMLFGPLTAVLPGLAAGGVCWAADAAGAAPLVAAGMAVVTAVLTTRGLHLDGLADTSDALAASYDRHRALEVMRRGDTGPAGVAAVVLVLILQVAGLAAALPGFGPVAVVIAVVAGRLALPIGCLRGIPAARPQGLGATVAGVVPRTAAAGMLLAVAGVSLALIGPRGLLAVGCAVLAAAVLLGRSVQRFGGITGDVLGACVEAATTAAALALSLHR